MSCTPRGFIAAAWLQAAFSSACWAAPGAPASAPIYSCVDAAGRRLSSDRPIPECLSQEQRLLNRDGSVRGTAPPLLSPEERERREAARRVAERARALREEAARRDRNLLARYPTPAAHDQARERALAPSEALMAKAQARLQALAQEAQVLATERGRLGSEPMSPSLRGRIGSNEGAAEAQRNLLRMQEAERARLAMQFDDERERLERLWAGQPPGTLGELSAAPAATPQPGSAGR